MKSFDALLCKIYFGIYRHFLVPLILVLLKNFRFFFSTKIQQIIAERENREFQPLPLSPVWVHSSSGEIEYAKPLLREIKKKYPHIPILLTYYSISAKKLLPPPSDWDALEPLPWDHPDDILHFLQIHQPRVLLLSRSDIWPELLHQCSKMKIPTFLFSATRGSSLLTLKSNGFFDFIRFSTLISFVIRPNLRMIFQNLTHIYCVSLEDQRNYEKDLVETGILNSFQVSTIGDLRWDQVFYRIQNPNPIKSELFLHSSNFNSKKSWKGNTHYHKTLVAGSTWEEDERALFPCLKNWFDNGGKLILTPHEISSHRFSFIEQLCRNYSFTWIPYSRAIKWENENILLIDQVGILAELYTQGAFAFVGGSFKDKVHSVMEPLAAGCFVILGPFMNNNREALSLKNKTLISLVPENSSNGPTMGINPSVTPLRVVQTPHQLGIELSALQNLYFHNSEALERDQKATYKFMKTQTGATEQLLSNLNLDSLYLDLQPSHSEEKKTRWSEQ